jgi:hypothetical protein
MANMNQHEKRLVGRKQASENFFAGFKSFSILMYRGLNMNGLSDIYRFNRGIRYIRAIIFLNEYGQQIGRAAFKFKLS